MHEGVRRQVDATRGPGNTGANIARHRLDYSSYESPEVLHAPRLNVMASVRAINASKHGQ